jgi:hypothetical protein
VEVTPIGWILLSLGVSLYWVAPQFLYTLMIFFIPFSATAVANIGSAGSASGVQASMLFGSLWILKELPALGRISLRPYWPRLRTPVRRLTFFGLVAIISLVMPLWINGHVVIESPELADSGSAPLQFTATHVTQTIYLIYGVLLTILMALKNSEIHEFIRSVRIFLISAIFVSLWGLFQLLCWSFNLDYPAYLFNTSATESALGYTQEIREVGLKRISSVATEPSMFAQCMLIAAIIALFTLINPQPLLSKIWDRLAVGVIVGGLLISTSTTAYVGLAGVLALYAVALMYLRIRRGQLLIFVLLFAGLLFFVYTGFSSVQDVVASMIVGKGESYSALARLNSVLLARDYFFRYPVLGLGWGSVTSHDLVFKLLSNTGLAGLLTFSMFLASAATCLWRAARGRENINIDQKLWPVCLLATLIILIFTNIAGGFAFTYGHVWFVFGLAVGVSAVNRAPSIGPHGLENLYPRTVVVP